MTETFTIQSAKKKREGTSERTGKPWTLYEVISTEGKAYQAWSPRYLDLIGQPVTVQTEMKQHGQYENLTIIEPKKGADVGKDLERVEQKVDECLAILKEFKAAREAKRGDIVEVLRRSAP